ncbi:hypothetical protein [Arcobacter sp. FWKO B]|uniref:hypothetical protein n=1 Tax=Arcobacter sp. FWKO B TaxID=2593672 RepID=UPI0018A43E1B|nr:hypothetical protein [Arcobacter sp. FWKO B]QOG11816.1 hypothetical protein FWKOB_03490 [Arcobacter sp. FWKO B]
MKKILFIVFLIVQIANSDVTFSGDPYKGQIYYKFLIVPQVGINGAVFTKQFTKQEWKEKFANSGKKFFEELNISKYGIDSEILQHLEAFCIYYASDSDVVPNCGS